MRPDNADGRGKTMATFRGEQTGNGWREKAMAGSGQEMTTNALIKCVCRLQSKHPNANGDLKRLVKCLLRTLKMARSLVF